MLYYLFRYLNEFGIPGSHMWTYISFRALLTLILSLIISAWFGEYFIRWMKRHHVSEAQRDKSIDPYGVEKKGVPTMGGIIIIVSIIIPCLLFGRLRNIYMILMLVTTVWLGLLGFADDYIKMKVTKDGLRPIYKLIGQTVLGLFVRSDLVVESGCSHTRECDHAETGNGRGGCSQKRKGEIHHDDDSVCEKQQSGLCGNHEFLR